MKRYSLNKPGKIQKYLPGFVILLINAFKYYAIIY